MTIYVDEIKQHKHTKLVYYCLMCSDTSLEELDAFAKKIGLHLYMRKEYTYLPIYHLSLSKRELAIKNGAILVTSYDLIFNCFIKPAIQHGEEVRKDRSTQQ